MRVLGTVLVLVALCSAACTDTEPSDGSRAAAASAKPTSELERLAALLNCADEERRGYEMRTFPDAPRGVSIRDALADWSRPTIVRTGPSSAYATRSDQMDIVELRQLTRSLRTGGWSVEAVVTC